MRPGGIFPSNQNSADNLGRTPQLWICFINFPWTEIICKKKHVLAYFPWWSNGCYLLGLGSYAGVMIRSPLKWRRAVSEVANDQQWGFPWWKYFIAGYVRSGFDFDWRRQKRLERYFASPRDWAWKICHNWKTFQVQHFRDLSSNWILSCSHLLAMCVCQVFVGLGR